MGIRNSTGTLVAQYVYDAWGKILQVTDKDGNDVSGNPDHIANINPFRYRGYYYDVETGWYYLNARYYDPAVGRFLSPDGQINNVGSDLLGANLFAYCGNNPVNRIDPNGNEWWHWLAAATIVVGTAVALVISAGGVAPAMMAAASVANGFTAGSTTATIAAGALVGGYYDPNVGRFLSPDAILITDRDVQIYNDSDGYVPNKNTIPPQASGYKLGKKGPTPKKTSNGVWGWADKYGNIWVPDTRDNSHGGLHWDVTDSKGNYINVYPDGHTRYGKGKVHYKSDSFYPEKNITFTPGEMIKDRRDSFRTSPSIDRHTILSDHTITKPVENNEPNITVTDVAKPVAAGLSIFVGWKIVKTIIAITMVPATGGTSLIIAAATP